MESKINVDNKKHIFNVKSSIILKHIFNNLKQKKLLEIIRYNKRLQNEFNKNIKDYYKESIKIIIDIIPHFYGNESIILKLNCDKKYYHLYFDDNKEEIDKTKPIFKSDKFKKIKIKIDHEVKSLNRLFSVSSCFKKIDVIKFNRNDINDISYMFEECYEVEEINFYDFPKDGIIHVEGLFSKCDKLKKLNISKFNTNNVEDMSYMFEGCRNLEKLDTSNFRTDKVKAMNNMFEECCSLKYLNLSNFNTEKVTTMKSMFFKCCGLKILNISSFKTQNVEDMQFMFEGCGALEILDISNFKFDNEVKKFLMFNYCSHLKIVKISNDQKYIIEKLLSYVKPKTIIDNSEEYEKLYYNYLGDNIEDELENNIKKNYLHNIKN